MSKTTAIRRVKAAQERLNKAQAAANTQAEVRDSAIAAAKGEGVTYGELRNATGLSATRLTQIQQRLRKAAQQ